MDDIQDNLLLTDIIEDAISYYLERVHTILIAKVVAVNGNTVDCQPTVKRQVGTTIIDQPIFPSVPVLVPGDGSSFYFQTPITVGSYVLLACCESDFSNWWGGNDNDSPQTSRTYDYSDAVVIGTLQNSLSSLSIPNDKWIFKGNVQITGNLNVIGTIHSTGNITSDSDIIAGTISLQHHVHGGVENGGGQTSQPVP
jgi:hypothetical protein